MRSKVSSREAPRLIFRVIASRSEIRACSDGTIPAMPGLIDTDGSKQDPYPRFFPSNRGFSLFRALEMNARVRKIPRSVGPDRGDLEWPEVCTSAPDKNLMILKLNRDTDPRRWILRPRKVSVQSSTPPSGFLLIPGDTP